MVLTEKRVMDRQTGKMCNANLYDYKVPGALDVPVDHDVVPIDLKDNECNNVGCKGIGRALPRAYGCSHCQCRL